MQLDVNKKAEGKRSEEKKLEEEKKRVQEQRLEEGKKKAEEKRRQDERNLNSSPSPSTNQSFSH